MIIRSTRRRPAFALAALGGAALLIGLGAPAAAAPQDLLLAQSDGSTRTKAPAGRRAWNLGEFTYIRLVPRESGAPANEQPLQVEPELLRRQLALVRIGTEASAPTLFSGNELADLEQPLAEALSSAGPDDDLLLLSSARRSGFFLQPTAVSARMFVQGGRLQMIVNETRRNFVDDMRGSHIQPEFAFGSRAAASKAVVQAAGAERRRADWLAWPTSLLVPGAAAAAPAAAQPAAAPMPAAPAPAAAAPAGPAATAPAAPAAGVAPLRPRDPGFADEVEQRLTTLKRLRDKGLISEDEYQQKRREILQQL